MLKQTEKLIYYEKDRENCKKLCLIINTLISVKTVKQINMTDSLLEGDQVKEIKFSFFYSMFSFWSSGVLVLVCVLSEGVAAFGTVLHSPQFLGLAAGYEVGKVWLAKMLSGHNNSFLSCQLSSQLSSSCSTDKPIRGPFLRKLWIQVSRLVSRLAPVWMLVKGVLILLVSWMFIVYITICFGAPISRDWQETGSFCLLVSLLTVYPCLLVHGPRSSSLTSVYTCTHLSPHSLTTLHTLSLYSVLGAWLGATPIPLDWDRDWQVWPVSCCLGAMLGHVTGNMINVIKLWPLITSSSSHHHGREKRKFI